MGEICLGDQRSQQEEPRLARNLRHCGGGSSSIVESSSRDCDVAADSSPLDLNLALAALASARFPFQHFTGAVLRQTLFCTTTLSYAPAWPVHVALHLATIIIPLRRLSSTPRRATQTLPLPLLSI
ncbi:hypothetical protein JHK85_040843 [Glycine max]|nr:hypothetical protein JHK86_040257 [Glycine max]KAG4965868.1 hypothetical protein JHK85_040843 [Glycine max]